MEEQQNHAPTAADDKKAGRPRCRCGYDRTHHLVDAKGDYTLWGWFLVGMGSSARPKRIRFLCTRCHEVFDETTNPTELRKFIYHNER